MSQVIGFGVSLGVGLSGFLGFGNLQVRQKSERVEGSWLHRIQRFGLDLAIWARGLWFLGLLQEEPERL